MTLVVATSESMLNSLGVERGLIFRYDLWIPYLRGQVPYRTTFWPTYPYASRASVVYFTPEQPSLASFLTRAEAEAMLGEVRTPEQVREQLRAAATAHTLASLDGPAQQELVFDPITALYWAPNHSSARITAHQIGKIADEEKSTP